MRYPEKSCYDSLGIPKNATPRQIKQAYYAQMKYFHPDVYPGSPEIADAKSKELNAAYALLSDPLQREQYDAWLSEQERHAAYERMRHEKARQAAEKAKKEAEERRQAAEKAKKETEARRRAAEQAQKTAEEAFYNAWWHEYAAYEATREEYAQAAREAEERLKQKEKREAKLKFWEKFQMIVVYMFLSIGPLVFLLYFLPPKIAELISPLLGILAIFILISAHVSSAVLKHLEGQV